MDRRDFLKKTATTTIAASLSNLAHASNSAIEKRALGRTGEKVSMIGIGGFHLGVPSEQESIRIVRTALDSGLNFLDNCWDYNNGVSEERMGKAPCDGFRQKAFLNLLCLENPFPAGTGVRRCHRDRYREGKIRYIGFTGHKSPDIHLKMRDTAFAHNFTFTRFRQTCGSGLDSKGYRRNSL